MSGCGEAAMAGNEAKKRLLSGIQPTGELHVGNYLGAIRKWVELQDDYESWFCVVDLHAMTVEYDTSTMGPRTVEMAKSLLACGVDPSRSVLFVQSHVPQHSELAWILACVTPVGSLFRMTQFKDKAKAGEWSANTGLLTYPVLQAADILLYLAEAVPVGEDQVQHIELTREIARKFNNRFGRLFPEPKAHLTRTARIKGLDGKAKMSKSLGNHVPILASPEQIASLLRPAFTDPARLRRSDPGHPEVCNVFTMHQGFTGAEEVQEIEEACRNAAIGCVDCKKRLARNMADSLEPVRERHERLSDAEVVDVLREGAIRARRLASATMEAVRSRTGLLGLEFA